MFRIDVCKEDVRDSNSERKSLMNVGVVDLYCYNISFLSIKTDFN